MTPFGIRKRIKALMGDSPKAQASTHELVFVLPDGSERTVQAEARYTLAMASQFLPSPIATGCPDGQCGQCVVEVLDARGLAPVSEAERKTMDKWHKTPDPKRRLACHARVDGPGARVRVFQLFDYESVRGT